MKDVTSFKHEPIFYTAYAHMPINKWNVVLLHLLVWVFFGKTVVFEDQSSMLALHASKY